MIGLLTTQDLISVTVYGIAVLIILIAIRAKDRQP
jgi:hypothetical protein